MLMPYSRDILSVVGSIHQLPPSYLPPSHTAPVLVKNISQINGIFFLRLISTHYCKKQRFLVKIGLYLPHIVVEVTKMGFEKGDNCEVCQLGKAGSTSVGGSTPTWWLPICCPCNKTTSLEPGFIDRYGKEIGIIIFFLKHNSKLFDTWQQDSPCGTFLCHTAPLVEP